MARMESKRQADCYVFPLRRDQYCCPSLASDSGGFGRQPCHRTQYGCFYQSHTLTNEDKVTDDATANNCTKLVG